MKIITAPETVQSGDLFLAGGISNCPNWQITALEILNPIPGVVLNPRRFNEFKDDDAEFQIEWEYDALHKVDKILFWFPKETLCPITLYELGVFSQLPDVEMFVGTDPEYQRRFDVVKQLQLARPGIIVRDNLFDTVQDYIFSL